MTTTTTVICPTCGLAHGPREECLAAARQAMIDLLWNVGNSAHCNGCGAGIFWITHKNGKKTPYTPAGLNHFVDCPASQQFRKPKAEQGGLF